MMTDPKKIIFYKIPLEDFIEILNQIYNSGANYIDIVGIPNEVQDSIGINIKDEYIEPISDNIVNAPSYDISSDEDFFNLIS